MRMIIIKKESEEEKWLLISKVALVAINCCVVSLKGFTELAAAVSFGHKVQRLTFGWVKGCKECHFPRHANGRRRKT